MLSGLENKYFKDRKNYIEYANDADNKLNRYDSFAYFFNEPLFGFYNKFLANFVSPDTVPKIGVFFISATVAYLILRYSKNWVASAIGFALLIFVSFTFHLQLVVLRQGIAAALLMWSAHLFHDSWRFYLCAFLMSFFHISFVFVFLFLCVDRIVGQLIHNAKIRALVILCSMIVVSLLALQVASALGVRQADSEHLRTNPVGVGGFLLFLFMTAFLCLRGLNNVFNNVFGKVAFIGFLMYLAFYYSVPISGRIIGTFLPFFYVYLVSEFRKDMLISVSVFLAVNIFIFWDSVKNGSLTEEGVIFFSELLII